MMTPTQPDAKFPLMSTLAALTGVGFVLAAIASSLVGPGAVPTEVLWGVGVVTLAAVFSVIPIALVAGLGPGPTGFAFLGGSGVRMICVLVALFIMMNAWPADVVRPVAIAMVGSYLALLAVEAASVARFLLIAYSHAMRDASSAAEPVKEALS